MPVKIRLARHGKKHSAFYHIVVADGRAPRDGKYIEKIGTYNPNTNPATIDIDAEKAMQWLHKGAQPTDTARAILSYNGILYKKHLDRGVSMGKITQEQADGLFAKWKDSREGKISSKVSDIASKSREIAKANLALEMSVKEKKAELVRAKLAVPATEEAAPIEAASDEAPATENPPADEAAPEPQA